MTNKKRILWQKIARKRHPYYTIQLFDIPAAVYYLQLTPIKTTNHIEKKTNTTKYLIP